MKHRPPNFAGVTRRSQVVKANSYPLRYFTAWLLILLIFSSNLVPSLSHSAVTNNYEDSIVIWPEQDKISDDATNDIAAALRTALPTIIPVHVISPQIAEEILSYHQKEITTQPEKNTATENLARAKEHYFQFHYDEALVEVTRTIDILSKGNLSENGTILHDALLTEGLIAKAAGNLNLTRTSFDQAARLNPFYLMDRKIFPPSVVELYERSRNEIMQGQKGALRIDTNPQAAEIFINGIIQGTSPLELPQVPVGPYLVLIKTNKYLPIDKNINIAADQKINIKENLNWIYDRKVIGKKQMQTENAKAEIDEGLKIADILKTTKAVIINCDENDNGGGILKARMFDRQFRAAHKQIVVEYKMASEKAQAIADMTEALAAMTRVNLLKDPIKYLDPDGLGDPILLNGRRREIYRRPVFWGAVGVAVAGGIAGGVAAALSGGGSSKNTGSVEVQFKKLR